MASVHTCSPLHQILIRHSRNRTPRAQARILCMAGVSPEIHYASCMSSAVDVLPTEQTCRVRTTWSVRLNASLNSPHQAVKCGGRTCNNSTY